MYFLLLVLQISLNLNPDIGHEQSRFFKTLIEKSLKFVSNKANGLVAPNLGLMLLPVEVNPILEKQGCKGYALGARGTGNIKIIIVLLTEIVVLYIGATIIQAGVLSFEGSILENGICFAMFLALNK